MKPGCYAYNLLEPSHCQNHTHLRASTGTDHNNYVHNFFVYDTMRDIRRLVSYFFKSYEATKPSEVNPKP